MTAPLRGFVWTLPAIIDEWIDGDSFKAHVWFEQGDPEHRHTRLEGVNSPERGQPGYDEARAIAEALAPVGQAVTLVHSRVEKYGRFLCDVRLVDGTSLSNRLLTHPDAWWAPYRQ